MMIDLKPCPFCGGEAKMMTGKFGFENEQRYMVECPVCHVNRGLVFSEEEAAELWNQRFKEDSDAD